MLLLLLMHKYKTFAQFPSKKIPRKKHLLQRPLGESPKNICRDSAQKRKKEIKNNGKPGETCPSCAINKYKICIKNQKMQYIYKSIIFSSNILQKVDVNQMKPT